MAKLHGWRLSKPLPFLGNVHEPTPGEQSQANGLKPAGQGEVRRLSLGVLFRRASRLSAASVIGSAVGLPVTFLAARWLGPTRFGTAQTVLLAYAYAALLRSGIFEAGVRAYIHHSSRGELAQARKAQNVAVSFESVVSIVPGLILLGGAFVFHDHLRRLGFTLAPVAVLAASVSSYFGGLYSARERFDIVATASLVRALMGPALLLAGVSWIGATALFIAPTLADLLIIAFYATRRPRLGLRPDFTFVDARPLFRAGLPLGALPVVYWAYRLVGSTSVALGTTARTYGAYAFAAAPVGVVSGAVAAMHAVLTPAVWGEMATDGGDTRWHSEANRVTVSLVLIAGAATNLAQAVFKPVVQAFVPQFHAAISIFDVLSGNILLLSVAAIPSLVLTSTRVNRQGRYLAVWTVALGVDALANAVALLLGHGPVAIAVNDIWIQLVVVVVIFALAWSRVGGRSQGRALITASGLALMTAAVGALLHLMGVDSTLSTRWGLQLAGRLLVAAAPWALAAAGLRRSLRVPNEAR